MERYLKDYAVASFGVSVALFLVIATVLPSAQTLCAPNTVCVTTWHNDNYRTGVSKDNFGQRCFAALDGQVYAQPLVVPKVTIGSIKYNYVVLRRHPKRDFSRDLGHPIENLNLLLIG
jgi:hypothetical protein